MPYLGILQNNLPFTLDVTPEIANNDDTLVTLTYLNPTGNKIRDIDILTIPRSDQVLVFSRVMPRNTSRVFVEFTSPPNGRVQARFVQGAAVIAADVNGDTRLVFNVE